MSKQTESVKQLEFSEAAEGVQGVSVSKTKIEKSSSSTDEHLDLSTEEGLRHIIECPICLEVPLPPIYLCSKGHIVCSSCQLRTDYCPLCRSRYGDTRSFVAESIVEKCTLKCKHAEQGCTMICKGVDMPEHLSNCDFRPVKCNDCLGKWIDFNSYHSHLTEYHKINGTEQPDGFVVYNMNLMRAVHPGERFCWPQYYFKAYDKTFLLRLYATNYFICSYVCLLGSKEDCDKYTVKIELHLPSDDSMMHTFSGKASHFRDDAATEIFRRGRGLVTPFETMLEVASISSDVAEWMYHVKITEVQVEAPETAPAPTTAPMPSPIPSAVSEVPIPVSENSGERERHVVEESVTGITNSVNYSNRSQVNNSYTLAASSSSGMASSSFQTGMQHAMAGTSTFGLLSSASLLASAYSNMATRGNTNVSSFMCSDWDDSDSTDYDHY